MLGSGEPQAGAKTADAGAGNSEWFVSGVKRFEAAWREGRSPSIDEYLPADPAQRQSLLVELAHIDLEMRLKRGEPARIEPYLARYPGLADDPAVVVELIVAEFEFRSRNEPTLRADELFARFPQFEGELSKQLPARGTIAVAADLTGAPTITARWPLAADCPHCGFRVDLADKRQTSRVSCPSCKTSFSVPDGSGSHPVLTAASPDGPGLLGHFELLEKVGEGGFGAVWKARDTKLDRIVALKVPRRGQLGPADVELLFREARAAARLRHPSIVTVYEVGRDGPLVYIVSDFIDGVPLDKRLAERRPTQREAIEFCTKVADALEHSHQAGVIHRDLKPGNILLDAAGQPHITDFGLAKRDAAGATMTVEGQIVGTPAYMSPEQARGSAHSADARTDIYSLGVVLFELLTGERPFRGNIGMIIQQVVEDDPPSPRKLDATIPLDLETITLKCLRKDPDRRYQTAAELSAELQRCRRGEPILARPVGRIERFWRWCRREPVVAGLGGAVAVSLLAVAIVATAGFLRERDLVSAVKAERDEADEARRGEQTARAAAEQHAADLQQALLNNLVVRGLSEYDAGSMSAGLANLGQAFHTIAKTDPLRPHLQALLLDRATHAGQWVMPPLWHDGAVLAVAYSPDGLRIATGSEDGTARLWNAVTGQSLGVTLRHQDAVTAVAFSPDGQRIATGSRDATARVWEVATGSAVSPAMVNPGPVTALAYSPDKRLILTACLNQAQLWDAATGAPQGAPLRHTGFVNAIAFSPDGKQVATAGSDKRGRIWDVKTGNFVGEPLWHEADVVAIAFNPKGDRIATAGYDNTARLWDAATGKPVGEVLRHRSWVNSVAFSPDGGRLATASTDFTARLWDANTGQPIGESMRHAAWVRSAVFSPDGELLLTICRNAAQLWDAHTGAPQGQSLRRDSEMTRAAFSPGGRRVVTAGGGNCAEVWQTILMRIVGEPMKHDSFILSVAISSDGRRIATGSGDKTVRLWDAAAGKPLLKPIRCDAAVDQVFFSHNGQLIVAACADKSIRMFDAVKGQPVGKPLRHDGAVSYATISFDDRWIATADADKAARIWDAATGQPKGPPLMHEGPVATVQFSRDNRRLVTASADKTAQVWDVATGLPVGEPLRHDAAVRVASFSPDGRQVLTASLDRTVRLWDADTGKPAGPVIAHDRPVNFACFSPDGRLVLTWTDKAVAQLWDSATGHSVGDPMSHGQPILAARFSPDGQRVVTSCRDRSVQIWDAATGQRIGLPFIHRHIVPAICFTPDSRRIVTGCEDDYARILDISPLLTLPSDESLADAVLELYCGLKLDAQPVPTQLTAEEIAERWQIVATRDPAWLDQLRQRNAPKTSGGGQILPIMPSGKQP